MDHRRTQGRFGCVIGRFDVFDLQERRQVFSPGRVKKDGRVKTELEQGKLKLKLERQNKFATNQQKRGNTETDDVVAPLPVEPKKKPGAPIGHVGWFRPKPTQYDWAVDGE